MKNKIYLLFSLLICCILAYSSICISGRFSPDVYAAFSNSNTVNIQLIDASSGSPVEGAKVYVDGSEINYSSDREGQVKIPVSDYATLVIISDSYSPTVVFGVSSSTTVGLLDIGEGVVAISAPANKNKAQQLADKYSALK